MVYGMDYLQSSPPETVVISDCNQSIPEEMFYRHPVRDTWIFHLGLFVFTFFQGLAEFLEWTWVNVMMLYTVEEITTAHHYLNKTILIT